MSRAWGHRPGVYPVIDEISGKEFWSDDLAQDWDGSLRHADNLDGKHPDFEAKHQRPERFPKLVLEPAIDAYVTANVTFYEGTDVPRLME